MEEKPKSLEFLPLKDLQSLPLKSLIERATDMTAAGLGLEKHSSYQGQFRPKVIAFIDKALPPPPEVKPTENNSDGIAGVLNSVSHTMSTLVKPNDHRDTLIAYIDNLQNAMGTAPNTLSSDKIKAAATTAVFSHKREVWDPIHSKYLRTSSVDITAADCFKTVGNMFDQYKQDAPKLDAEEDAKTKNAVHPDPATSTGTPHPNGATQISNSGLIASLDRRSLALEHSVQIASLTSQETSKTSAPRKFSPSGPKSA